MATLANTQSRIPASLFNKSYNFKFAFKHGELTPYGKAIEIYPGDALVKNDFGEDIRMSTPIFPFTDPVDQYIWQFYVPWRLVFGKFPEFLGVNKTTKGYQSLTYKIPFAVIPTIAEWDSIGGYFGLLNQEVEGTNLSYSALLGRAYLLIWTEYFRDEMLQDPVVIITGGTDNAALGMQSGQRIDYNHKLFKVNKKMDRFTVAYTDAFGGPEIRVPLGGMVPVMTGDNVPGVNNNNGLKLVHQDSGEGATGPLYAGADNKLHQSPDTVPNIGPGLVPANLWANLGEVADSAPLNALYFATALDFFQHKMQTVGHRYNEIIGAFWGVYVPESIDRPILVGQAKVSINVSTVYNQDGQADGPETKLGLPGAVSRTISYNRIGRRQFNEHGILITLTACKHQRTYSQGIPKFMKRRELLDFYTPPFANTGYEAIEKDELYCDIDSVNKPFGYRPRWDDLRFENDVIYGALNPNINPEIRMTLGEKFAQAPILNSDFIEEDRDAIANMLITGQNGPDYFVFGKHNLLMMRSLPVLSIPGFVGHY